MGIYNQLAKDAPVVALNPERKMAVEEKVDAALGGKEAANRMMSGGPLFRVLFSMIASKARPPKTVVKAFLLAPDFIKKAKQEAQSSGVEFVSTNDVATSAFFNSVQAVEAF